MRSSTCSALTDFEELSVYDCRTRPDKTDKASTGRILYIRYDEYVKRWDEIASVFGKKAVWEGVYDLYGLTNEEIKVAEEGLTRKVDK